MVAVTVSVSVLVAPAAAMTYIFFFTFLLCLCAQNDRKACVYITENVTMISDDAEINWNTDKTNHNNKKKRKRRKQNGINDWDSIASACVCLFCYCVIMQCHKISELERSKRRREWLWERQWLQFAYLLWMSQLNFQLTDSCMHILHICFRLCQFWTCFHIFITCLSLGSLYFTHFDLMLTFQTAFRIFISDLWAAAAPQEKCEFSSSKFIRLNILCIQYSPNFRFIILFL